MLFQQEVTLVLDIYFAFLHMCCRKAKETGVPFKMMDIVKLPVNN